MTNWLSHLFVPRPSNNFRAKLLHHDFLTIYLVGAIFFTIGLNSLREKHGDVLGYATDITVTKLYDLTNGEREKIGLKPLAYNKKLEQAAQAKARDMFAHNYWAHYSPEGKTPWDFIVGSGYQYEFAGENLAKNFMFSRAVVDAWMASPTHRENIVRPEYKEVGYAVANGIIDNDQTTLVVQMFGSPFYGAGDTVKEQSSELPDSNILPAKAAEPMSQKNLLRPSQLALIPPQQPSRVFQFALLPAYTKLNTLFLVILIIALSLDFYFAAKLNMLHITGKNLIHIMFLGFMLVGTVLLIRGSII